MAAEWDLRVSHAILGSNGRRVLEAIGLALRSQDAQVAKFSLVAATWFATQLAELPDTGLQAVARNCFLQPMVLLVQQNGKEMEEKVLASLALNSFLSDAGESNHLLLMESYTCCGLCDVAQCQVLILAGLYMYSRGWVPCSGCAADGRVLKGLDWASTVLEIHDMDCQNNAQHPCQQP